MRWAWRKGLILIRLCRREDDFGNLCRLMYDVLRLNAQLRGGSETASCPIAFRHHPGETVTITLTGGRFLPGLVLTDRHYLILDGIDVEDAMMWAQILDSSQQHSLWPGQFAGTAPADLINQNDTANLFGNNFTSDPLFVDADARNLRLDSGSLMIDAGAFLTRTVGAGTGTVMTVQDAGYFYDGYGISDETGDEVQLHGQTETALVVAIDYDTITLTLDRPLTWSDNQGFALKYNGSHPDVGAFESP